jgi:hypothetical protein
MHRSNTLRRVAGITVAAGLLVAVLPGAASADSPHPNPTSPYIVLTGAAGAGTVVPLINSGDVFDGETFEGIPDGIGVIPVDATHVDLYVAFEQSHVPFQGFADFEDSSVHRVRVHVPTKQVVELEEVLSPDEGLIRFCSAFMAGPAEGFDRWTMLLNEESDDVITVPDGAAYGADPAIAPYRQAGYAVALDIESGEVTPISRLGRHNHENAVPVPGGWNQLAILSGDDTFNAPSSQLYLYTAKDDDALVADKGQLWAFQVTRTDEGEVDPYDAFNDANDYLEIQPGDAWGGRFIHVPTDVARGRTGERPQAALESWSNANNVFQFVRVEDLAYDPINPRVVYFADTGTNRLVESDTTGRLFRAASGGTTTNGRIFRMVLNEKDPRIVDDFSILLDAGSVGMRSPDNLAVGANSIMVQEDASSAKVWRYDRTAATWSHVASVTHPASAQAAAAGESTGIVDVSGQFGAGWWALDVQSHVNLTVGSTDLTYVTPLGGATLTYRERREDGQLLLMHIPGS